MAQSWFQPSNKTGVVDMRGRFSQNRFWRGGLAALALVVAIVAGAGSDSVPVRTTDFSPRPIAGGTLVNPDLTIFAEDGSFTLQGGQPFRTPFATSAMWSTNVTGPQLPNVYAQARGWGARPVTIRQAGRPDLYGLLLFNNAIPAAYGPGSQSYYVNIPQDKLDNARMGNITVAFEAMRYRDSWDSGYVNNEADWYGWILWMSSAPL